MTFLAEQLEVHGEAIEYDLLTKTRFALDDVGDALPWGALLSFLKHLPADSAYRRETVPGIEWADGRIVPVILADIYDGISAIRYAYARRNSRSKPKTPKPYPRPGRESKETKRIGAGAIPVRDFEKWWRGEHGR